MPRLGLAAGDATRTAPPRRAVRGWDHRPTPAASRTVCHAPTN